MQRQAPDRQELERIIIKLTGRAPDFEDTISQFEDALASHNVDDVRSKSKITLNSYEIEIFGNAIKSSDKKNFEYYLDKNGSFQDYPDTPTREKLWEKYLDETGWKRLSGLNASDCEKDAKIYSLRCYGSLSDKGEILLSFPCQNPDGAKNFLWITTASVCDHSAMAEKLIASILKTRSIMPGTQRAAIKVSEIRLQTFMEAELKERNITSNYQIAITSSWRTGFIILNTYDNLLRPQRRKVEITLERCEEKVAKVKNDSKEDIQRLLGTHKEREKQVQKGGLIITGLAKNIVKRFSVEKPHPYKTMTQNLTIEERLSIRHGIIGAKIIITKYQVFKIKITNNTLEMPAGMASESIRATMIGSRIKKLIDYEGLSDDMIITSFKVQGKTIKVRFTDVKTPWSV